jgi:hypothetical protein
MTSDRANATVKKANGKHIGKVAPSTRAHEVIRAHYGVVFVGSRTACNQYWVRLASHERKTHTVQMVTDTKW